MKSTRKEVYKAIDGERDYQDNLSAIKGWLPEDSKPAMSVGDFLTLIRTYSHKADVVYSENKGDHEPRKVIRKIAGICVQCLEQNGVIERKDDQTVFE